MHNDIEVESFIVVHDSNEEIERINPIVFTLDALYHLGKGFVISLEPGVEIERSESYFLARLGLEYEQDFGHNFYVMPTVFLRSTFRWF